MNDSGPRYKNTLIGMSFFLMGSTVTANAKMGVEENRPCQGKRYFMDVSSNSDTHSENSDQEGGLLERRSKFVAEIHQRKRTLDSEGSSNFLERALRTRVGTSRMNLVQSSGGACTPPS